MCGLRGTAMLEFLARNEVEWRPPSVDETVETIEAAAAGRVSERELADWLRATAGSHSLRFVVVARIPVCVSCSSVR